MTLGKTSTSLTHSYAIGSVQRIVAASVLGRYSFPRETGTGSD